MVGTTLLAGCASGVNKRPATDTSGLSTESTATADADESQPARKPRKPVTKPITTDYTDVKPTNHKVSAEEYMNRMVRPLMKDPESMKLEIGDDVEVRECENDSRKKFKLWTTLAGVNAKNSFGAYTGVKPYMLFYVNGEIESMAYDLLLGTNFSGLKCIGVK